MNGPGQEEVRRLAAAGFEACLRKLSEVSPGQWRLEDASVSAGDPAAAIARAGGGDPAVVLVKVDGPPRFSTALLFARGDMERLAACFLPGEDGADAGRHLVSMLELGNILLNSLINSVLKALGASAIPSVPLYLVAGPGAVREGLPDGGFTLLAVTFSASRGGKAVVAQALAVLPDGLVNR